MNTTCPDCGKQIYTPYLQREKDNFNLCHDCGIKQQEKMKLKGENNLSNKNGEKIK